MATENEYKEFLKRASTIISELGDALEDYVEYDNEEAKKALEPLIAEAKEMASTMDDIILKLAVKQLGQ